MNRIKVLHRRLIVDKRGWFLKTIDGHEESLPKFTGEVYVTSAMPGQTKGYDYCKETSKWFTLLGGKALFKAKDLLNGDEYTREISFNDAITLYVPNMVAHSFTNIGDDSLLVLCYTDHFYDKNDSVKYNLG